MIRGQSAKLDKLTTKDMKKQEMVCMIRANKKLKNNLAGYSAMKKEDLKVNLEKALSGQTVKARAKPTQHKWNAALKEFNKNNASYIIPKKGTKDYEKVREIMESQIKPIVVATTPAKTQPEPEPQPDTPTQPERLQAPAKERKKRATKRAVVDETTQINLGARKSTRSRVKPVRFAEEEE